MIRRVIVWWRQKRNEMWNNACMYDPEYDMWFENHPLHPNYDGKVTR